ncbi:hypothetical protein [Mycolicibacterium brisbanense]
MDLQIVRWIREQDENGAVSLARTLCMAEAGRHGLPLDSVSISGRVKAADGGIDGRTNFPAELETIFPRGRHVWQIKSGKTAPSAAKELDPGKHGVLLDAIKNGADYVLFWTNDPVDPTRDAVREDFEKEVRKVRADANVTVLIADGIEQLCYQHVSVLAQHGPMPISGLAGLEVWAPPEFLRIEFQADESRRETIELLREHVAHAGEPNEIHVVGDTGVGKSRLVYEALSQDGVRERVLVAPDPNSWYQGLLTDIANTPGSSLILVVDDCDVEDRRTLTRLVGMSRGRIRLITTGARATRERSAQDRRRRELLPLEIEVSQKIALSKGLDEQQAALVASLTEGYPGLADALANAIALGQPDAPLLDRIRGDDDIGPVLATLLAEDELSLLGLVALFERIGFEGDLALELTLACEVFGVDETAVRTVVDREMQRFVSTAGRFRRVTPRVFAVWLASRFLQARAGTIVNELDQLPESLRERILDQMRQFVGDPVVSRTLKTLLDQAPFNSGAIAGVDDGAARLIHVASIVNPYAAMDAIERIMNGLTTRELASARDGRRDLVQAIEVLLWSDDLFERAATAALRLAMAENETWTDNATGAVKGMYRVYLGATSASYKRRIDWTRGALRTFGADATPIIVSGLASAFDAREFRMSTDFGGGNSPVEWRPATVAEEIATRQSAWELLIEIAERDPDSRGAVASSLSTGLRTALLRGISTVVLASLTTIEWPARGRAELIEALNHARAYDNLNPELEAEVVRVIALLSGEGLSDRAKYVFAASVWELTDDRSELLSGLPKPLVKLVEQAVVGGAAVWRQMIEISKDGNPDTASRFFEQLAKQAPSPDFQSEMEGLNPPPLPALTGYLRGLVMVGGVNPAAVLEGWSANEQLRGSIVRAAHLLPATDELARIATTAVSRGWAPAQDLGQFLYGGWTRTLEPDVVAGILALLGDDARKRLDDGDGHIALQTVDNALGIADQWTADNPMPAKGTLLRSALSDLFDISEEVQVGSLRGSAMLDVHIARIIPRLGLTTAERLTMLLRRFQSLQTFPSDSVLEELDELIGAEPTEVARAIVDSLKSSAGGDFDRWSMWLEDAKVLSRIQRGVELDQLADMVGETQDARIWSHLLGHIAFDAEEPDPLLVVLLGRSDDPELRAKAIFQFMHPRSSSWGLESDNLKRRREVAVGWRASPARPALFVEWLDQLIEALDAGIGHAEEREAERGW